MTKQRESLIGQKDLRVWTIVRKQQRRRLPIAFVVICLLIVEFTISRPAFAESLARADSNRVCMMTNKVFPTPQIPVPLHGKTYYGCCSMCAGSLAKDPKLREAIDLVSGRRVDKAEAVAGVSQTGDVYYFENEKNMKTFQLP